MRLHKLPRSFYLRPTVRVARELPGKYLVRRLDGRKLIGRIVEVEAYRGVHDPASHAYRGKTARNEVMFRTGGHLYVYFTYGMHFCCNVVTEREGRGMAVLLRAVEPVDGLEIMAGNRHVTLPSGLVNLCSGPGKLCQSFGIARPENGTDLTGDAIWIAESRGDAPPKIVATTRIGIREGRHHRWRFCTAGSPFVSRARPVEP